MGVKFSKENSGYGSPDFHATSHLKIEAKIFISQMVMLQCNSLIPYNNY